MDSQPLPSAAQGESAPGGVRLSVVAPCFNEEGNLPQLLQRLTAVCRAEAGCAYEIVLVNDGSRDGTWSAIRTAAETDRHVVGVNLSRNHGHQLALTAGLTVCRGERVLIIDADLQDPPELLGEMMRLMDRQQADVVYGQRSERLGESRFKIATAALFYRVFRRLADIDIPMDTGDFRLISRRALDVLNAMPEHHRFVRGMVSWIGFRQVPIRYKRDARHAGATGYPIRRMVRLALDGITGFSVRPLRLAAWLGFAFGMLGLTGLAYTLLSWIVDQTVQGWTSLMTVVLLLGSVQLLVIGVLGEYVGRLYMEAKRRPLFIIEDVVTGGSRVDARDDADLVGNAASAAGPGQTDDD